MKRLRYLDIARGIGIMLIIISHAHGLSPYLINYYIPIFFVVSGFVYKEGRTYGENIGRKAKRLLIPYFSYSAVLLAIYAVIGRTLQETKMSALGILYSRYSLYDTTTCQDNVYLFTVANGAMWYLTAFFMASLVYHLVIDYALKSRKNLVIVLTVLAAVTIALAELPILLPWSADIACVGALFMIVGTLLGQDGFYERTHKFTLVLAVFVAYIGLSTINPGINMSVREYGVYGRWSVPFFILIGITGSMLCIWAAQFVEQTVLGKVVEYIGKNTIILVAFHIFGLEVFEMIAGRFIDVAALAGVEKALYVTVRVTVTVCGCLILGKFMDMVKKRITSAKSGKCLVR